MSVQDLLDRATSGLMVEEESKLPVYVVGNISVTAKEVRELVASNPDHPAAKDMEKAVANLADDYTVNIDKANLFAIAKNKKLVEKRVVRDGEASRIRVLSDEDAEPAESTTTTTSSKMNRRELEDSTSTTPSEGSSSVGSEGSARTLSDSPQSIREATKWKEERAGIYSPVSQQLPVAEELPPDESENRQLGAEDLGSRPASSVEPKGGKGRVR